MHTSSSKYLTSSVEMIGCLLSQERTLTFLSLAESSSSIFSPSLSGHCMSFDSQYCPLPASFLLLLTLNYMFYVYCFSIK